MFLFVCLPHTLLGLEKRSDAKHRNLLSWPNNVYCLKCLKCHVKSYHNHRRLVMNI